MGLFKEELEVPETFLVRNGGVKGQDAHGKDEMVVAEELKV